MIISTTSKGSLVAGDWCVVEASRETSPKRILRILARVRHHARLTSSSIAVVAIMVKRSDDRSMVSLPDNEDVGVFVCGIMFSLQEVENAVGSDRETLFPPLVVKLHVSINVACSV